MGLHEMKIRCSRNFKNADRTFFLSTAELYKLNNNLVPVVSSQVQVEMSRKKGKMKLLTLYHSV